MDIIEKLLKKYIKDEEVRNEIIGRILEIRNDAFSKAKEAYGPKED